MKNAIGQLAIEAADSRHREFISRVLAYATKLKAPRREKRAKFGKCSKQAEVHNAKLNTLQTILAMFDKTVANVDAIKRELCLSENGSNSSVAGASTKKDTL